MKFLLAGFVALAGVAAQAQNRDSRYYEIKRVVVTEVRDVPNTRNRHLQDKVDNFTEGCENPVGPNVKPGGQQPTPTNPLDLVDVIVDKIINIGKKIWAIVDAGRPVVNLKYDTAHALPAGIKCWTDLEGWSAPQTKLYQAAYENGFGSTVVNYAFRVSFISGGSWKGQGDYITMATIQPTRVEVAWGFNFDAVATVPIVFNQGTRSAPIAGMQLVMNWQTRSPLKHIQEAESFFINGQGRLEHLKK